VKRGRPTKRMRARTRRLRQRASTRGRAVLMSPLRAEGPAEIVRQATDASSLDVFDSLLVEMIEAKRTAPKVTW
jgi:hypothetical protein